MKICGRCQSEFECRADDILNCQCNTVSVSNETHLFLQKTHFGCLCKNCLIEINEIIESLKNEIMISSNNLKEEFHYYMEGDRLVFTENYLILRGFCCQSGCRHCPYGFKKA